MGLLGKGGPGADLSSIWPDEEFLFGLTIKRPLVWREQFHWRAESRKQMVVGEGYMGGEGRETASRNLNKVEMDRKKYDDRFRIGYGIVFLLQRPESLMQT